jgi:hypothetical protein
VKEVSEAELYETMRAGTDEMMERVGAAFLAERGWRNQMRAAAYELLYFLEEDHERARRMVLLAPASSERVREVRDEGWRVFTTLIDLGRQELDNPRSVAPVIAEITVGAIYDQIHRAVENDEFDRGGEMIRELMCSAVLPYCGSAAALEELSMPPPRRIS